MAAQIPAALKTADVQRFATRAAQLEKHKPIASYWLEYYVLQQILTRSLHNDSPEVAAYAAQLMDKVEATKSRYHDEPAIVDDIAAQAYMEQFAADTLSRAEKSQHEDAVTRQTADTLQAAATFYDSTAIWGEPSMETKVKTKFAKFHALRIAKALKEGRDPNEGNPKPEPVASTLDARTDEAEIQEELKQLEQSSTLQSSVEDAMDTQPDPPVSSINVAPVSPIDTTSEAPSTRTQRLPSPATTTASTQPEISYSPPAAQAPPIVTSAAPVKIAAPPPAKASTSSYNTDDDAVMLAQKHAKWAISALNFEDVPTAVRELKIALQTLGGM